MGGKEVRSIVKVASVFAGSVLGAGFASGRELLEFFGRYGAAGIGILLISSVFIGITGWAVMDICVRHKITGYSGFMKHILGPKMGGAMNWVVMLFTLALFAAMMAGSGAAAEQADISSFSAGTFVMAGICFITFLFDIHGVVKINLVLAPIMVVGGILIGVYSIAAYRAPVFSAYAPPRHWLLSAVLYAGYNMITAISLLASLKTEVSSRKIAKYGGLAGGLCVFLLGLFFTLPLIMNVESVYLLEIPMLAVFEKNGRIIEYIYIFILFAAIFTTAVGDGFVLIEWLHEKTKLNKMVFKIALPLFGAILAHVGFSVIVAQVYPLFGYIGIFEVLVVILTFLLIKSLPNRK